MGETIDRRFWVSCSSFNPDSAYVEAEEEVRDEWQELDGKLSRLFPMEGENDGHLLKTYDVEEVKNVVTKAISILKELGYDDPVPFVSISTQPVCPECGTLGRFSDFHCSQCGVELLEKEYVDIEDL